MNAALYLAAATLAIAPAFVRQAEPPFIILSGIGRNPDGSTVTVIRNDLRRLQLARINILASFV